MTAAQSSEKDIRTFSGPATHTRKEVVGPTPPETAESATQAAAGVLTADPRARAGPQPRPAPAGSPAPDRPSRPESDMTMHATWACRSRELLTVAATPAPGRLAVPASRGSPASCRLSGPKRGAWDV